MSRRLLRVVFPDYRAAIEVVLAGLALEGSLPELVTYDPIWRWFCGASRADMPGRSVDRAWPLRPAMAGTFSALAGDPVLHAGCDIYLDPLADRSR